MVFVMNLRSIFCLISISLLFAGCTNRIETNIHDHEEKEQQMSMDHNQCVSYGFPVNTVEYSNCLMKLDQQRIEAEHQKELQQLKVEEDKKLNRQIQNPGKICNSRACY